MLDQLGLTELLDRYKPIARLVQGQVDLPEGALSHILVELKIVNVNFFDLLFRPVRYRLTFHHF